MLASRGTPHSNVSPRQSIRLQSVELLNRNLASAIGAQEISPRISRLAQNMVTNSFGVALSGNLVAMRLRHVGGERNRGDGD